MRRILVLCGPLGELRGHGPAGDIGGGVFFDGAGQNSPSLGGLWGIFEGGGELWVCGVIGRGDWAGLSPASSPPPAPSRPVEGPGPFPRCVPIQRARGAVNTEAG